MLQVSLLSPFPIFNTSYILSHVFTAYKLLEFIAQALGIHSSLRVREWRKDLQTVGTRTAVSCAETLSSYNVSVTQSSSKRKNRQCTVHKNVIFGGISQKNCHGKALSIAHPECVCSLIYPANIIS